ncbi:MAG: agmatinase [Rhodomicrobiaceae bacterium]
MGVEHRFQFLSNSAPADAQIVFLPVGYDDTVCGVRGTAAGPEAIFEASETLEYYDEDLGWSPFQHMRPCVLPEITRADGETEAAFHARIEAEARRIYDSQSGRFLIALGGEHSITPSVTAGCLDSPATVVVLDAHADLRATYQGSALSHACTMHRLREQGHPVIIIGLRSLADFEAEKLAGDEGISAYWARDLQREAGQRAMIDALLRLKGDVWLSVDMDVFDPALVPGVGTPQPGGLGWYAVMNVLRSLFENAAITMRGIDVVELIPEASQVSQVTAAKLVQKAVSFWGKQHKYDEAPRTGAQSDLSYE